MRKKLFFMLIILSSLTVGYFGGRYHMAAKCSAYKEMNDILIRIQELTIRKETY